MAGWISRSSCFNAALLLSGCGDPLVDGQYHGEPLLTLGGEVLIEEELGESAAQVQLAVFWANQGSQQEATAQEVDVETAFPARYELRLYTAPPLELAGDLPSGGEAVLGFLLVYLDEDGDRSWQGERVVGGSTEEAVMYVTEAPEEPPDEQPEDGGVGYRVMENPTCGTQEPPQEADSMDVTLTISAGFQSALPDIDCDGELTEWDGLCEGGCGLP